MSAYRPRGRRPQPSDSAQQHRDWLSLIEVSGPFLSLPVLRATWPSLDALDKPIRDELRQQHSSWQADPANGQHTWLAFVLGELLGWGDALAWNNDADLATLALDVPEHDARVVPDFALVEPGEDPKPATTHVLGLVCPPGSSPMARIKDDDWPATPVDRMARLCRHHEVQLGLVTDGRWWTLVWAPRSKVTTTATFDAVSWPEVAERVVVRAFVSLLCRRRFFGVPVEETLVALLKQSEDSQEEITEALGIQVRQAVELLVASIGQADTRHRARGEQGLTHVSAHEVYRGAVSVMMRIVFVLFAEERGLLPADRALYTNAYSVGRLCALLEQQALEGSEDDLAHSSRRWHRLLAVFDAIYRGIDHPRLTMTAHDGSLFDPDTYSWLQWVDIDDRTLLHMLRAVQYVEIGTGKAKERRRLSFRELDVEQIGYVYEGLLSYDAFRAEHLVVSLIGSQRGSEKEVWIAELESIASGCADTAELARAISTEYKDYKVGSPRALEKALAPLTGADLENARRKLLAVTDGDTAATERLLPFVGIIRQDLRGLPVVIRPGELYVTDSPLRRNTGTHYTPRKLAEEIVEGALEPLVYEPGPLQTGDSSQWTLKSSQEILALKIADIAMGSAAFLVAATRYLAGKLIEAWTHERDARVQDYAASDPVSGADVDPVVIEARREIIEHCLYGADINEMAVEMAKLSLWLVSMDPHRPFTFLDDRLVTGDSLLGLTSLEQLEYMHMDPKKGRELHESTVIDFTAGVRELIAEVAEDRRKLAEIDGSSLDGLQRKRALLEEASWKTGQAKLYADLTVGAALAHSGRGDRDVRKAYLTAADLARQIDTAEADAREQARRWLDTDLPDANDRRQPVHWPLAFPEVFEKGGFDGVIGNPPFLHGSRISGSSGHLYREHLVDSVAASRRGNADLVAYFLLRACALLNDCGQVGLIATNTLAQGDTRQIGLDQVIAGGDTIRASIKSRPWPSKSAAVEYAAVWITRVGLAPGVRCIADDLDVSGITSSLDPAARIVGDPMSLTSSRGIAYYGTYVLGMGFTMNPDEADRLVSVNPHNADVLFPYLGGDDLNSNPQARASRWIVYFRNWSEDRAKFYKECYKHVRERVRPERENNSSRLLREKWWQFKRPTLDLFDALSNLEMALVIARHSKTVLPLLVPARQVMGDATIVFASEDTAMLALLSSAPHYWWAKTRGSSMKADLRYTPSDVFETFPLPELTEDMRELGNELDTFRRDVMLSRDSGLTKTYNLVFDPACTDDDIEELRRIHRAIDEATIRAYGWEDRIEAVGGLDHGFHPVGRETRYTIGTAAQREILDSLLELNHDRYAEELAQGLHDKGKTKRKRAGSSAASGEEALF